MSAEAQLASVGEGRFRVTGNLGFETVKALLAAGRRQFAGPEQIEVDLSGITHSDSAGLALLIEWLKFAQSAGKSIRYTGMPEQLRALARISEVEELLPVGSQAS